MSKNTQLGNLVNGIYVDASSNVGIGTTTPSAKLHTVGTLRINNPSVSGQYMELYTSSGISYYNSQNNSAFYTAFQHIFNTDGATPTERMRITSTGNVGIGASTSPTYLLEVSTAGGSQRIRVGTLQNNNNSSTFEAITTSTNTTASAAFFRANAGGTATIGVSTYNKSGGDSGNFANLSSQANTVAIQIAGNGNVMIKTETSLDALTVNGGLRTTGTGSGNFFDDRSSSNFFGWYTQGGQPYFFNGAVGNIVSINPSNGAYSALSDINKKKDFEQSNIGLNEVLQLKPTLYRFKTDDESSDKELGFIAQEVKDLIPQAYTENGEGDNIFIGLNQMPLIAALTKAIQELSAEVQLLKNK